MIIKSLFFPKKGIRCLGVRSQLLPPHHQFLHFFPLFFFFLDIHFLFFFFLSRNEVDGNVATIKPTKIQGNFCTFSLFLLLCRIWNYRTYFCNNSINYQCNIISIKLNFVIKKNSSKIISLRIRDSCASRANWVKSLGNNKE